MKYSLLVVLFLLNLNLSSQAIHIERLDISDGLPDNSVRNIIQDQKGYLWFGTLNGLSKYDGNNFKNHYSIPGDTTSLSNSRIGSIREDTRGFIWSWSDDLNIQRINPITNEVVNINRKLFKNKTPIQYFRVVSNGDIWVWGNYGCSKIEYLENNIDLKVTTYNEKNGFVNNIIYFLNEDNKGNIWVGTETGLVKISSINKQDKHTSYYKNINFKSFYNYKNNIWFGSKSGEIFKYSLEEETFSIFKNLNFQLKGNAIRGINQLNSKTLLIASDKYLFEFDIDKNIINKIYNPGFNSFDKFYNDSFNCTWIIYKNTRGIFKYSVSEKKIEYFDLNKKERIYLGDPDKHQILEDSNKNIWVGIHGGGLFRYNRTENKFKNYKSDEEKIESISSDIILYLFEDSSKNLWVGTMHGGINKINLSKENFTWHYPSKKSKNIYENEIRAVVEDKKGNLWLGSKGGKIFCYKNNQLKYTLPNDLSKENQDKLKNISVYSLYIDHDNNLWVGTKGKGIYIIKNIINNSIKNLDIINYETYPLNKIYSITQDKNKNYWVGSHGTGLALISNPFNNSKLKIYNAELTSKYIRYLFFDDDDNLWVGTNDGISLLTENQLNVSNKKFISIKNIKEDKTSLSYNSVDHIFQASDKSIYASTMGGGINILSYKNLKNRTFKWKHLNMSNGLSSNKIFASQEDAEKNIWISTSLGINKYYSKKGVFENFFTEKKLIHRYFSEGCVTKLSNGDFLFGNHKGFITFNTKQIVKDTTQFPLVLSKLLVNGNEQFPRISNLINKNIEYEKSIELKHDQNNIQFNFSILDFKNPGKNQYTYKLNNYDKNWSTSLTSNTAIYQNLPHGKYTFMLRATNSDGVLLPEILKFKVNITPPFFKSYWGYFIELVIFGLLFLSFLYLYKKQISAKQQVVFTDKLNEKKLIYYTNISHEFKTPLTLISCHLQDIINDDNITMKEVKSINKDIQKSSNYLLNLVEQILDFRKIKEEKMKLFLTSTNIVEFTKDIYSQFLPLANSEKVYLEFNSHKKDIYGYIDIRILKKITYNLLSNAIKFTPTEKTINISLEPIQNNNFIELKIKDEGIGISEEDKNNLFERFSKSENSSGLGLSFVKELVDLHKGTIKVDSELNKGTCFTIKLPISKNYYSEKEIDINDIITNKNILWKPKIEIQEIPKKMNKQDCKPSTILIIEDNDEMRDYLSKKFKKTFNVSTAKNGKEGIEIAIKEIPDIIICDLMMPIMDGIETIKELKGKFNTCHIPIILLTANSSEHKKIEGIKIGADDYINKPFNVNHLEIKVEALISQRKRIIESFSKNPELSVEILTNTEEDKKFIQKIKKIVEDSMGESNFSINSTASKMGLSRTNFYTKMKAITGGTPNDFIRTVQMKKAARLLKDTNYPISEISIFCGFNDNRYFSKKFKEQFGKSPKEYQLDNKTRVAN